MASALCFLPLLNTQPIDWQAIVRRHNSRQLPFQPAPLAGAQRRAIRSMLLKRAASVGDCDATDTSWADALSYDRLKLGPRPAALVQVIDGCGRSGQGANRALWVVGVSSHPAVLAGLTEGWFDDVQPTRSHGMHDFTVGSHIDCCSYNLVLYRFSGKSYRDQAEVKVACDEDDRCTITPIRAAR